MPKFFSNRIRLWWKSFSIFSRHFPLAPQHSPEWEDVDCESLHRYLQTETGHKLVVLIRCHEQANNAGAVVRADRHEYACGFAAGYRGCAALIGSLSEIRSPQETEKEQLDPLGAEELVENLAP